MQDRSLLLIAWLTFVSCSPYSRDYASGSDASATKSRLDAGERPSPSKPDADVADETSWVNVGTGEQASQAAPELDAPTRPVDAGAGEPPACEDGAAHEPAQEDVGPSTDTAAAPTSAAAGVCSPNPCLRGTCKPLGDAYECTCPAGYEGKHCEHDIDDCADNPCVHGTCTDLLDDFRCACSAGWGGKRCDAGSCTNVTCPSSAPCRVPSKNAGICYPEACIEDGLCVAENPDGSGAARIFAGRNSDLRDYDWGNRARYFAYIDEVHGARACVFPQTNEGGAPLVIPLGTKATKSSGFGLSNSWPSDACQ